MDCDYAVGELVNRGSPSSNLPEGNRRQSAQDDGHTYISSFLFDFQIPKRKHSRRYKLRPPYAVLGEGISSALTNYPFEFSALDMELFHNYLSSTSLTLAEDEAGRQLLQTRLPELGYSFNYVLRLLLAFSGFHIAHLRERCPQQISRATKPYVERAEQHFAISLRQLIPSVTELNPNTYHALYAASSFMCFCTLARGPQPGDYLAFSSTGQAQCLTLLHGVRSILQMTERMSTHAGAGPRHHHSAESTTAHHEAQVSPFSEENVAPLGQIRQLLLNELEQSDPRHSTYCKVHEDLVSVFHSLRSPKHHLPRGARFPYIFGWLFRLPGLFVADLHEQRPLSLVLFAFFVVLLKDISCYWFMEGWPEHIMAGIYHHLDEKHRPLIQWPREKIS
ncbi:hypothetical protein BO85DRAFT_488077 [Aspergillus piperis CBS 112811]|uniref:C6 transcription factor n=1 Tax=Aspergillus piperis CBS 112811 TaxID=1448313 RepID=A0A8G1R298_9EURO|nr:hypothetical protein BO85DRAFT_488077 [Aspergillus piperis CBS 112811]RAH57331.1 hypothetical protein BO85DRAFT_488077 [Aspergillus piperis CBS 112811]